MSATLEVYETIQKHLLPTPTKIHYTFNLRDVSKVIQVSLVSPESHAVPCSLTAWSSVAAWSMSRSAAAALAWCAAGLDARGAQH